MAKGWNNVIGCAAVCFGLCASVPVALGQHAGDVVLRVNNGRIATGVEDTFGAFVPERIYTAEFGELFPDTTDEPGFDNDPFTFTPFAQIGFRVRDALRRWSGTNFDMIPPSRLEVAFGVESVLTPTAPAIIDGFPLSVGSNGTWHRHYDFTLQSPAGNGVYLLQISLWSTDSAVAESEPFWILFGQNVDFSILDAAEAWARQNLLGPAPCTDLDFNNDSLFPDTQDIEDLLSVFAGATCPIASCDSIDFNADGLFPDTLDIEDFLTVFAGGMC